MKTKEWCEQRGILPVHFLSVKMIIDRLTDAELAAQYSAGTAGSDDAEIIEVLVAQRSESWPTSAKDVVDMDEDTRSQT